MTAQVRGYVEQYLTLTEGADNKLVEVLQLFAELKGGSMRAGSICSGLGTFEMVLQRFQAAWSLRHPDVPFQACFCFCSLISTFHSRILALTVPEATHVGR